MKSALQSGLKFGCCCPVRGRVGESDWKQSLYVITTTLMKAECGEWDGIMYVWSRVDRLICDYFVLQLFGP